MQDIVSFKITLILSIHQIPLKNYAIISQNKTYFKIQTQSPSQKIDLPTAMVLSKTNER